MPVCRTLDQSPYFILRHLPYDGLFIVIRRPTPFPSIDAVHWAMDRLERALRAVPHAGASIIVDIRAAIPRNDPAYEEAMEQRRRTVLGGFKYIAVLVRTLSGKLQVTRHAQTDGLSVLPFHSLDDASHFLRVPLDDSLFADPDPIP